MQRLRQKTTPVGRRGRPAGSAGRRPAGRSVSPRQLQRLPTAQRRDAVARLGAAAGNQAVQRYLDQAREGDRGLQSGILSGNGVLARVLAGDLLLRRGSGDPGAVRLVQLGLATLRPELDLGQTGVAGVDGDFGPRTEQGVRAFQAELGLATDGIVGPETLAMLDRQLAGTVTEEVADGGDPAAQEPQRPGGDDKRRPIRQDERAFGPGAERDDDEDPLHQRFSSNNMVRVYEWPNLSDQANPEVQLNVKPWRHQSKLGAWGRTTSEVELHLATLAGKDGRYRPVVEHTAVNADIKLKEASAFSKIEDFKPIYEEYKGWFGGNDIAFGRAMATYAMSDSEHHAYDNFGTVDGVLFHELLHATIARKQAAVAVKKTIQGLQGIVADDPGEIFDRVMKAVDDAWKSFQGGQMPESGDDHLKIYTQEAIWYLRAYEKATGEGK